MLGGIFLFISQYVDTPIPINVSPLATQTVAEMKKIQTIMEFYLVENGTYPLVGEVCQKGENLSRYLVSGYLNFYPVSLRDNMNVSVSDDGLRYVLQTKISAISQTLLTNDVDGIILGCDCNDPNFCFVESHENSERLQERYY